MNEGIATTVIGALLSFADLVVNVLPLPIVSRLNVPVKQRIAATILLSLGTIATAAGVVREVYVYRGLVATHDKTWESLPLWICADVEIYVGLVLFPSSLLSRCSQLTTGLVLCLCSITSPILAQAPNLLDLPHLI